MKLYQFLAVLLVLPYVSCEDRLFRVPLHLKYEQEHLVALVNMLQKSQAELMDKESYEHAQHNIEEGSLTITLVQIKKQQLHRNKQQNKHRKLQGQNSHSAFQLHQAHISRQHKMTHDQESLMDVFPTQNTNYELGKLQPANKNIENGLDGDNQLFFKQLFKNKQLKKADLIKINEATKGAVHLKNVGNTMFIGALQVGTQQGNNTFQVIFDTGSALICITSKLCDDIGCKRAHQYDRHKSKTFNEIGKEVEITFGSGILKGLVNKEKIQIDGMSLNDAVFIEITKQIGDAFHAGDFDGIVGLGYPHMTGVPTLFDYMIKQHKLEQNKFTFHLNREPGNSGSQLIFGGVDNSLITGEWVQHKVIEKFYWTIPATDIYVGEINTGICSSEKPCNMVIDTGTTLLTGPTKDVKKLLSMVSVSPKCSNFYDMPSITFIMQGQKYILKAEDYVLTITDQGVEPPYQHSSRKEILSCAGTLFPMDIGSKQGPLWILGDVFISKYSSSFDRDNDQVGLAMSKWYSDQQQQNFK